MIHHVAPNARRLIGAARCMVVAGSALRSAIFRGGDPCGLETPRDGLRREDSTGVPCRHARAQSRRIAQRAAAAVSWAVSKRRAVGGEGQPTRRNERRRGGGSGAATRRRGRDIRGYLTPFYRSPTSNLRCWRVSSMLMGATGSRISDHILAISKEMWWHRRTG
jgi:hypothetical protein